MADCADVGEHCAACRRQDFLPRACEFCELQFCDQCVPREAHECAVPVPERQREPLAPVAGVVECAMDACAAPGNATCPHCDRRLCLAHRHAEAHSCEGYEACPAHLQARRADGATLARAAGASAPPARAAKKPKRPLNEKQRAMAAKVGRMKIRSRAKGPGAVTVERRVHMQVTWTATGQQAFLFLASDKLVGHVVDAVIRELSLRVEGPEVELVGSAGAPLEPSAVLGEAVMDGEALELQARSAT